MQLISELYKSNKLNNFTGVQVFPKSPCNKGSIVNGIQKPILYSLAPDNQPGQKIYKEPRIKLFAKINKSILSHITLYLGDADHELPHFNGDTISFTCQLYKI